MHFQSPSDRSKCVAYNPYHSSLNIHQVVGLTLFDLRRREKVDQLGMVGVNGSKFPAIRQHLQENIGQVYKDMDTSYVQQILQPATSGLNLCLISPFNRRFVSYPEESKTDPEACTRLILLSACASLLKPRLIFRQSCDRSAEARRRGHRLHTRQYAALKLLPMN